MVVLFFLRGPWIKFLISWWFGLVVWIPGIPLWKGSLLGGTPTIPNHQPKPPNYYILLDWISVTYCWTCSLRTRQVCCQAIWGFSDRWVRAPRPWPSLLAWTIQPADIIPMKELSHRKRWCEKIRGFSQQFCMNLQVMELCSGGTLADMMVSSLPFPVSFRCLVGGIA